MVFLTIFILQYHLHCRNQLTGQILGALHSVGHVGVSQAICQGPHKIKPGQSCSVFVALMKNVIVNSTTNINQCKKYYHRPSSGSSVRSIICKFLINSVDPAFSQIIKSYFSGFLEGSSSSGA